MTELGPDAKQLVAAGRAAFKPTEADRERVLQALLPQLGAPVTSPVAHARGFGGSAIGKISLVVVGLGVVGGGLMLALPNEKPAPATLSAPPTVAEPTSAAHEPVPVTPTAEATASAPTAAPAPSPGISAPPRGEDHLAEEVAILSRAGAALRSGQPAVALKALAEHQRRFPTGVLAQERSAARIQALCALGRVSEGLAELKRLEQKAPRSPHVARARKACGLNGATP